MQSQFHIEGKQRIHKVLAHAGLGSRRACEALVVSGRVTVNGHPATIGQQVSASDTIRVDGQPVQSAQARLAYYMLNKPAGVVSSAKDKLHQPTVVDVVQAPERVYPVGRLDVQSDGLVLLTNDGELAYRLTHPRFGVSKVYQVWVAGRVHSPELVRLCQGIELDEGLAKVAQVKVLEASDERTLLRLSLTQGYKRQIRRMCEAIGHPVQRLRRIALGTLKLGNLAPGQWRSLTANEVTLLYQQTGLRPVPQYG